MIVALLGVIKRKINRLMFPTVPRQNMGRKVCKQTSCMRSAPVLASMVVLLCCWMKAVYYGSAFPSEEVCGATFSQGSFVERLARCQSRGPTFPGRVGVV